MKYKIHTIDLGFLGHSDTIAAFLIEAKDGLILVETGPHSTFKILKQKVEKLGFNIENISHIFLSHIHFDHAGAAWSMAKDAKIYVHPTGEKHLIDPSKLYNSAKQIYGDKMDMLWGQMEGIPPEKIHATAHEEVIKIGNLEFKSWHTPGHAVHHIAWQLDKDLFTGDVAGVRIGNGIVVPPCPPPDIDIESWIASINLLKNLKINTLHLTHFGQVKNIKSHLSSLEKRLIRWANWIKKRYDKGLSAQAITPQYQAFVKKELERYGIVGEQYEQYESANPAWMSVAGIVRYWHKKTTI